MQPKAKTETLVVLPGKMETVETPLGKRQIIGSRGAFFLRDPKAPAGYRDVKYDQSLTIHFKDKTTVVKPFVQKPYTKSPLDY